MPEKNKGYSRIIFSPEVVRKAVDLLIATLPKSERKLNFQTLEIRLLTGEKWKHDTEEEFFADYVKGFEEAIFRKNYGKSDLYIVVRRTPYEQYSSVDVLMPDRSGVEKVFGVFEDNAERCRLPEPPKQELQKPKIKIFVGHGHNPQWKDLKDHLHEKQGLDVEAYEIGARGGLTVKEVLDEMLTSSSFALLVFTGEDQDAEGKLHARENVIHELGLFQGRLGWSRAIVLLEEGVSEFSNIHGTEQVRFAKNNIQATYGEVLAIIKREFSGHS